MIQETDFIITPDKFLSLASNYISRYGVKITLSSNDNIIFIKTDFIENFENMVLPQIPYKFVLITHDSDFPITEKHLNILNNKNLIMWFGMNCHIIHDKLQPVPIGIANEVWPHGNKDILLKIKNENNAKQNLVYCNFDISTNSSERASALHILKDMPFIDFEDKRLSFEDYLRKLSTYKYVISPPGNSVDCHRIWESIYVETIPICLKSIPLHFFKDSPILFINQWEDVNQDLLTSKYATIKSKSSIKSDFKYYTNMIHELAKTHISM